MPSLRISVWFRRLLPRILSVASIPFITGICMSINTAKYSLILSISVFGVCAQTPMSKRPSLAALTHPYRVSTGIPNSTAAFDDPISFDSFTACTLYFVLYFRWFRAVFSCFLSDWKPIKWTAFSDGPKMFAMYNCRLILVETASGFAVGLALVQRLICGFKYIAVRLGPVGEGRTRA